MAGTRAPMEGATSLDWGHSQAVFEYTRDIKIAFLVTIGLLALADGKGLVHLGQCPVHQPALVLSNPDPPLLII